MSSPAPSLSVIVPVHNAEPFLARTLQSVLGQGYPRLELIVVDDGSTDGSAAVAQQFPEVRYLRQTRRGPPAARNLGLELARGELVSFLDADDLWSDDRLAVQLPLVAAHPEVELVAGRFQWVREVADPAGSGSAELAPLAAARNALSLGTALFRRGLFETVGALDETLWYSDDVDWFLRARERGVRMLLHPEVVLWYRRHRHNITNDVARGRGYFLTALKKSLDRRRVAPGAVAGELPAWDDFTGRESRR